MEHSSELFIIKIKHLHIVLYKAFGVGYSYCILHTGENSNYIERSNGCPNFILFIYVFHKNNVLD